MPNGALDQTSVTRPNVPDDALETAARQMARAEVVSKLALAVKFGFIIVEHCYGNSWKVWNSRNEGDTALVRLAKVLKEKHGLRYSASTLYRYVRAAEQSDTYGRFARWPNLSLTHLIAVQGLDWKHQDVLLERCNNENLSKRDLEALVAQIRARAAPRSAPRAGSTARALINRLDKLLDERRQLASALADAAVPVDEISALMASLDATHERLEAVQARVPRAKRSKKAGTPPA